MHECAGVLLMHGNTRACLVPSAFLGRYLPDHWLCNEIGQPLPCSNFWDAQTCPSVQCVFEEWNCLPNTDPEGEDATTVVPTSSASLPAATSDTTPAVTAATTVAAATSAATAATSAAAASTVSMITSPPGDPSSCDSNTDEDACMVMAGATCFWEWQTAECRDRRCVDEWDVARCNVRQPRTSLTHPSTMTHPSTPLLAPLSSCIPVHMPWNLLYWVRMLIGC